MIPDGNRKKLDAKSRRVTFVGYSETGKNFRVFDRERRKVFISYNIKFNETKTMPIMDEFYCEQEFYRYKESLRAFTPVLKSPNGQLPWILGCGFREKG